MDVKQKLREIIKLPLMPAGSEDVASAALAEIERLERYQADALQAQAIAQRIMARIRDFAVANQAMALQLSTDLAAIGDEIALHE